MVLTAFMVILLVWSGMAVKYVVPPCDQKMFDSNVENCLSHFKENLETTGYVDHCPWPTMKLVYYKMKVCVDNWANVSWCRGQGFLVDSIFLKVHNKYFSKCGQVQDPPLTTLILLIVPITIVTLFLPLVTVKLTTHDIEMPSSLGL